MPRVLLITGASRGIGAATAVLAAQQGWAVAVNYTRDAQAADHVVQAIRAMGGQAQAFQADVGIESDIVRLFQSVDKEMGSLGGLVNNAGVADFGPIEGTDFARWRRVMDTNLDGVFLMSQAFTPLLKAAKGAIVNIASISGLRASTLRVAYGTSKAAVMHLTRQQAAELGEYGIRANCVCPGPVRTKLAMAVHSPEIIAAYHDAIPLNRYGSEDEIGQVIHFLCSDKASYVTGQIIASDGGFESTGIGLPALRV